MIGKYIKLMIKELLIEFTKGNRLYKQIEKAPIYYVYEVTDLNVVCGKPYKYYEIFKRRIIPVNTLPPSCQLNYNPFESYIPYPTDESFGEWAWCCSNLDRLNKIKTIKFTNKSLTHEKDR